MIPVAAHPPSRNLRDPVAGEKWHSLDKPLGTNLQLIASAYPANLALAGGTWPATYKQLVSVALRIAGEIPNLAPAQPPSRIAILMRHDTPLFAAVFGTLIAGHIVVALNPTDPPPRLAQVISDSEPSHILTDSVNAYLVDHIKPAGCPVLNISDRLASAATAHPLPSVPLPAINPDQPAFLIYTSGSSGKPKGVIQTHRNILHNAQCLARGMQITAADRVALLSAISGGQGIATSFLALLNGATLYPFATMEKGVLGLDDWLDEHRISIWVSAASLFRNFTKVLSPVRQFSHVRLVRLGSESIFPADFSAFIRHTAETAVFMPTLSSTETGNITQNFLRHGESLGGKTVPVGNPVEDVKILLLDELGNPVADGEVGEICVRGHFLSPGYWRNEALTKQCFSVGADGARLYRSGDMGRRTPQGLFHMGRKDSQVKIRGYRVELLEIQQALERHPDVERAAVWTAVDANDSRQVSACVVPRGDTVLTLQSLRDTILRTLPLYMAPTSISFATELPLNAHGKVDLESLRQTSTKPACTPDPPVTPTEIRLAEIWKNTLKRAVIDRHADFFLLGGDSLSAAIVAAKFHAITGDALNLKAFSDHPTLSRLAAHVDSLLGRIPRKSNIIPRAPRDRPLPLSYTQERIWRTCRDAKASRGFTMSCAYRITGPLQPELFEDCVHFLVRRHEILRSTFHGGKDGPVQKIHTAKAWSIPILDFTRDPDPNQAARAFLASEATKPFDLECLPLARFFLARIAPHEHHLLRISHHIISDAWSWRLFFTELAALYEARKTGESPPFADTTPLGFADYAAWQRQTLHREGPAYQSSLNWWASRFRDQPPPLKLPFARPKTIRNVDRAIGTLTFRMHEALVARLDVMARKGGVTPFMIRLAALTTLLSRQTGQQDLVMGAYITNRQHVETQQMFGNFANLATMRLSINPSHPFEKMLDAVRDTVIATQANGNIPYEQLSADLRSQRPRVHLPEISAIIAISDRIASLRFADLEFSWLDRVDTAPWGFTLSFDASIRDNQCRATFDPCLHDPSKVAAFIEDLKTLLEKKVH